MSWQKALIIARLIRLERRAPKDPRTRWERYWASVRQTGAHGDVLWDGDNPRELQLRIEQLRQHSDASLPVVDVGCGNGRLTRRLAEAFRFALGVDVSQNAIVRAVEESRGVGNVAFRTVDMTAPDAGRRLMAEFGPMNVLVRGVFHILEPPARVTLAGNIHDVVGARGTVLVVETHFAGSMLDYLVHLGATPARLPLPLELVIAAGLPRPSPFGEPQRAACFAVSDWEVLDSGATQIHTVALPTSQEPVAIPGYFAVLRARRQAPQVTVAS